MHHCLLAVCSCKLVDIPSMYKEVYSRIRVETGFLELNARALTRSLSKYVANV
jgi:hypothetical protein